MAASTKHRHCLIPAFIAACFLLSCRHDKKLENLAASAKDSLLIYIMAGQSNMAGRGVIEPQDTGTNPRIYTIDSGGNIIPAREPLHLIAPGYGGLDCGMSFAQTMLSSIPAATKICLVPCAVGSTSIRQWLGDSVAGGAPLYSNLLRKAHTAMNHGMLKGILWHQGEANAETMNAALDYERDLRDFIAKLRSGLGNEQLPFLCGTLADFCRYPYKDTVNAAMRNVAGTVQQMYIINTADLSGKADSLHFDSAGQRALGQRFAAVAALLL